MNRTAPIRAKVQEGKLVLDEPVPLPDGTEVIVQVVQVPLQPGPSVTQEQLKELIKDDPLFGMWADRDDIEDSVAWLERERKKWWRQEYTPPG
jgi:hypothetical protein